jgi:hypothetical protein
MANPNIVDVTSIYGKTSVSSVAQGTVSTLAAGLTDHALKINSITVSNTGSATTGINVYIDVASTAYYVAFEIDVPAGTTLVVTDKNTSFYIIEGTNLRATCSTSGGTCSVITSYEELDDA